MSDNAGHETASVNTLIFGVVIALAVLVAYFVKRKGWHWATESGAAVFIGAIILRLADTTLYHKLEIHPCNKVHID